MCQTVLRPRGRGREQRALPAYEKPPVLRVDVYSECRKTPEVWSGRSPPIVNPKPAACIAAQSRPSVGFGLRRCGSALRCPHASVRYAHPLFIARFVRRAGTIRSAPPVIGCILVCWLSHVCPSSRRPKGHRDLTSSATVAVRGAPWLCSGAIASRTWWVTIPVAHQPRLLPPSGEEAVRRSLTDGRGICKA